MVSESSPLDLARDDSELVEEPRKSEPEFESRAHAEGEDSCLNRTFTIELLSIVILKYTWNFNLITTPAWGKFS